MKVDEAIGALTAVRSAIDYIESLPACDPVAGRARVRALALLWAAFDELEGSPPSTLADPDAAASID